MTYVTKDQDCHSMNIDLTKTDEDSLSVNFVCGTQLFVFELCMRPRIEINLKKFNNATDQN